MTLPEPQEQFERENDEPTEEPMDEMDSSNEAPLSDSDSQTPSQKSESVTVPSTEKLPPPAEGSIHTEGVEGPAWYVIHCYSGYENKVRHNLEQRIETMGMKDRIFDVVIPTRSEEHTSELQSRGLISYAVFCLKKNK